MVARILKVRSSHQSQLYVTICKVSLIFLDHVFRCTLSGNALYMLVTSELTPAVAGFRLDCGGWSHYSAGVWPPQLAYVRRVPAMHITFLFALELNGWNCLK